MDSPYKKLGDKHNAIAERNAVNVHKGEARAEGKELAKKLLDGTLAKDAPFGRLEDSNLFETSVGTPLASDGVGSTLTSAALSDLSPKARHLEGAGGGGGGGGLKGEDSWITVERSRAQVDHQRKLADQCFERLRESLSFSNFPIDENMQKLATDVKGINLDQFLTEARRRNHMHSKPFYRSNMDRHERNALFSTEIEDMEVAQLLEPEVDIEESVKELGQRLGLIAPNGGWKSRCDCDVKLDIIKQQNKTDERRVARAKFMTAFTKELDKVVGHVEEFLAKANEAEEIRNKEIADIRERQYAMISRTQQQKQTIDRLKKRMKDAGMRLEEDPTLETKDTMNLEAMEGYKSFVERERIKARNADIPRKKHKLVKRKCLQMCANTEKCLMAQVDYDGYVDIKHEEYLEKMRQQRAGKDKAMQTLTDEELLLDHGLMIGFGSDDKKGGVLQSHVQQVNVPKMPPMTINLPQLAPPPLTADEKKQEGANETLKLHDDIWNAIDEAKNFEKFLGSITDSAFSTLDRLENTRTRIMSSVASLAPADSEIEREMVPLFGFANTNTKGAIDQVALDVRNSSTELLKLVKELVAGKIQLITDLHTLRKKGGGGGGGAEVSESLGGSSFAAHVEEVRSAKEPSGKGAKAAPKGKKAAAKPSAAGKKSTSPPPKKAREASPEKLKRETSPAPEKPAPKKAAPAAKKPKPVVADAGEAVPEVPKLTVDFTAVKQDMDKMRNQVFALKTILVKGTKLLIGNDRIPALPPPPPTAGSSANGSGSPTTAAPTTTTNTNQLVTPRDPLRSGRNSSALTSPMLSARVMALLDDDADPKGEKGQQTILDRLEEESTNSDNILILANEWLHEFLPSVGYKDINPDATIPLVETARTIRRATESIVNACTHIGVSFPMDMILDVEKAVDFGKVKTVTHVTDQLAKCEQHVATAATRIKREFSTIVREEQRPLGEQLESCAMEMQKLFSTIEELFPEMYVEDPMRQFMDVTAAYSVKRRESDLNGTLDELFDESVTREQGHLMFNAAHSCSISLREHMRKFHERADEEIDRRAKRAATQLQTKMVEETDKQAIREAQRIQKIKQEVDDRIRSETERMKAILEEEEERLASIRSDNQKRVEENNAQTAKAIQLQEELKVLRLRQAEEETDDAIEKEMQRLLEAQEELFNEMLDSITINEDQNRIGIEDVEDSQFSTLKDLEASVRDSLIHKQIIVSVATPALSMMSLRTPRRMSATSLDGGGNFGSADDVVQVESVSSSHASTPAQINSLENSDAEHDDDAESGDEKMDAAALEEQHHADVVENAMAVETELVEGVDNMRSCAVQATIRERPAKKKSKALQFSAPKPKMRTVGVHCDFRSALERKMKKTPVDSLVVGGLQAPAAIPSPTTASLPGAAATRTFSNRSSRVASTVATPNSTRSRTVRQHPADESVQLPFIDAADATQLVHHQNEKRVAATTSTSTPASSLRASPIVVEKTTRIVEDDHQRSAVAAQQPPPAKPHRSAAEIAHEEYMRTIGNSLPYGYVCATTETDRVPPTMQIASFAVHVPTGRRNNVSDDKRRKMRLVNSETQTSLCSTCGSGSSVPSDSGDVFFATLNPEQLETTNVPPRQSSDAAAVDEDAESHDDSGPLPDGHPQQHEFDEYVEEIATLKRELFDARAALAAASTRRTNHYHTAEDSSSAPHSLAASLSHSNTAPSTSPLAKAKTTVFAEEAAASESPTHARLNASVGHSGVSSPKKSSKGRQPTMVTASSQTAVSTEEWNALTTDAGADDDRSLSSTIVDGKQIDGKKQSGERSSEKQSASKSTTPKAASGTNNSNALLLEVARLKDDLSTVETERDSLAGVCASNATREKQLLLQLSDAVESYCNFTQDPFLTPAVTPMAGGGGGGSTAAAASPLMFPTSGSLFSNLDFWNKKLADVATFFVKMRAAATKKKKLKGTSGAGSPIAATTLSPKNASSTFVGDKQREQGDATPTRSTLAPTLPATTFGGAPSMEPSSSHIELEDLILEAAAEAINVATTSVMAVVETCEVQTQTDVAAALNIGPLDATTPRSRGLGIGAVTPPPVSPSASVRTPLISALPGTPPHMRGGDLESTIGGGGASITMLSPSQVKMVDSATPPLAATVNSTVHSTPTATKLAGTLSSTINASTLFSPSASGIHRAASANMTTEDIWEKKLEAALNNAEEERARVKQINTQTTEQTLVLHRVLVDTLKELVKRIHRDGDGSSSGQGMMGVFNKLEDPFTNLQGVFTAQTLDVVRFDTNLLNTVHKYLRADSSLAKKRISVNLEQAVLNRKLKKIQERRRNREFAGGYSGAEVPQVAAFLDRQEQKLKKAIEQFTQIKEGIAREKEDRKAFYLPMTDVVEQPQLPHMAERRRLAGARANIRTPVEPLPGQHRQRLNNTSTSLTGLGAAGGPHHVGDFEHQQHPGNHKRIKFNPNNVGVVSCTVPPPLEEQQELFVAPGGTANFNSPNGKPPLPSIQSPTATTVLPTAGQNELASPLGPTGMPWHGGIAHMAKQEVEEKPIDIIMRTAVLPPRALPPVPHDPLQNARAPPVKHVVVPKRTTQVQPDRDFFTSFLHGHAANLSERVSPPPQFPHDGDQQQNGAGMDHLHEHHRSAQKYLLRRSKSQEGKDGKAFRRRKEK